MTEREQNPSDEPAGERLRPTDETEGRHRDPEPPEDVEEDPAYNPPEGTVRDLKGG